MDDELPSNNADNNLLTLAAAIETILDEPIDREPDNNNNNIYSSIALISSSIGTCSVR